MSATFQGVDFTSYDMTVSMFDAYLQRMPLVRTERIMDMSQAALYAQLTNESRQRMWGGWGQLVSRINTHMIHTDSAYANTTPITWNGAFVSMKGLFRKFAETFGKGGVE